MEKNKNQKLITWISVALGAVSSLILLFILRKRPTNDHEIMRNTIPKIKLPDETELTDVPVTLVNKQPKLRKKHKPKQKWMI